ncbi:aldo/keto reductase [Streptomyces sp. NPDC059698]|uniref:aldo/keto reductase n=1 Tax=unclassified Streptomyces TaxID=2593676 RepID=UPI00093ADFCC|nr:aldo/keto reductase [Streptomyces sp. CB02366]OKJ41058.1 aldo/keto reductase [Streptomyces sp. CB02366]TVP33734.1 aldo/keto reductase [Streptomyces griseus subsp. griseus]WSS57080.1 aldo/keto reductase [Streptomyces sp. NBC_01178]
MRGTALGTSGPEVGVVGLGCMGMSWAYDELGRDDTASVAVVHRAVELGCTLIDTADMYGPFTNEELVGRALRGRRDEVVLATKGGLVVDDPATYASHRDGRPEHLRAAFEASLKRLGVDHVDLYQLHRVDPDVPVEESWGAMAELVQEGKARAIGLSEASVEEIRRAQTVHPVASVQSELSLWSRDTVESGVLDHCREQGIALIAFSPLGRGFLSGRIGSADDLPEVDGRRRLPRFQSEALAANLGIVDRVRQVADRLGATPAQVALAWVLAQGENVVVIPGTKNLRYLEENAGAARVELDDAALAALQDVPAAVGTRY